MLSWEIHKQIYRWEHSLGSNMLPVLQEQFLKAIGLAQGPNSHTDILSATGIEAVTFLTHRTTTHALFCMQTWIIMHYTACTTCSWLTASHSRVVVLNPGWWVLHDLHVLPTDNLTFSHSSKTIGFSIVLYMHGHHTTKWCFLPCASQWSPTLNLHWITVTEDEWMCFNFIQTLTGVSLYYDWYYVV